MARITNDYQTRITNAETSWRRESVWEYEVMFEGGLEKTRRTREATDSSKRCRTAATLASVVAAVWQLSAAVCYHLGNGSGSGPAAIR